MPWFAFAIILYLRAQHETLAHLGLKRDGLTPHALLVGLVSAVFWVAFNKWVYLPFISHFFSVPPYTEYDFIRNRLPALIFTILAAWVIGGFYEELVFRGFIQRVLQGWFVRSRFSFWLAAFVTNILFGLYHWQQGIFGIIPSFLGGLLWSYLFWHYKGNLWYPILSHGLYDTIALVMIYYGIPI